MSNPAVTYEREMVPAVFGPWVQPLLERAHSKAGDRVLDLACGTGIVARCVARANREGGAVSGLDLNPAMLSVARECAERERLHVAWHEGRGEDLPFGARSFDLVLCQQGLQFFTDRAAALAEVHRVLDRGGRLGLSVWHGLDRHPFFAAFNDAVVRHLGIPALAAPFALGDRDELRALLQAAGFERTAFAARSMDAHFPDPGGFVAMEVEVIAAAIPSAQHLTSSQRAALVAAIAGELSPLIQAHTADGKLVIPFHAHVVTAVRAQDRG